MSNYKPSADFVENVMAEVRQYEAEKTHRENRWLEVLEKTSTHWLMSSGAIAIGLWNIARICLALFGPVVCR